MLVTLDKIKPTTCPAISTDGAMPTPPGTRAATAPTAGAVVKPRSWDRMVTVLLRAEVLSRRDLPAGRHLTVLGTFLTVTVEGAPSI